MKFRAKIVDSTCIKQFLNLVTAVSRLAKNCILRITADSIVFIVPDEQTIPRRTVVWAVLEQNIFFEQYDMVGVNAFEANNEIFVEFNISLLAKILTNLKSVKTIKMKLTHKTFPALTVDIELPSQNFVFNQQCVHEVPITVVPLGEWRDYKQPDLIEYDIIIESPPLRKIKNITDKLKQLSDRISMSMTQSGTFSIGVNTIPVTVNTLFKHLNVDIQNSSKSSATALLDVKRFVQFLNCEQLNASKVVCNIISDTLIHWYLERGALKFHYYLTTTVDD